MSKTSDKSQLNSSLQNNLPARLETVKVIKNKGSLRNCHSQEEPKDSWWWNVTWCPKWDPGAEKDIKQTIREIWISFAVQSLSHGRLFAAPWTAARQASLSFTISLKFAQIHVHWVGVAI